MKIVSVALERYCDKMFSRDSQRSSSLTIPVVCLFNSFLSPVQTTPLPGGERLSPERQLEFLDV